MRTLKFIVERHSDGFLAYTLARTEIAGSRHQQITISLGMCGRGG
jgi:hypothetical protein